MATHHGRCVDGDGHFLEGAEIFIYSGNGFLADVSAEDGSSVDQPLIAGADGSYAYSAAKGEYRHSVWHAGRLRAIEYGIVLGEAVGQGGSLPDSENHAGGTFDVRDFGAVGNGIVDDTPAIARAGAALQAAGVCCFRRASI